MSYIENSVYKILSALTFRILILAVFCLSPSQA